MTVAHTSILADHYGQEHRDDSCQFMDLGEQRFTYILVPYAGAWQGAGLNRRAALLNRPLPHVAETYHEGPLGGEYRGVCVDQEAVEIGALKRAEDGCGHVLRLAETTGAAQRARVELHLLGRALTLDFTPFEVKTLYLPDDAAQPVREIPLTEIE